MTDNNIRSFEKIVRKYNVDFAVKKDKTPDSDMLSIMCGTIKKLQNISDEEFESYEFIEING